MAKEILTKLDITDRELRLFSNLIYSRFGIVLDIKKKALVVGRLQKVLRERGFRTFAKYYDFVISDTTGKAASTLIDRISTNHTFFFRESDHFDFFTNRALPEMADVYCKNGNRDIRIWSAGCSSGEEPYTLLMLFNEYISGEKIKNSFTIKLLGTDISISALSKAAIGEYSLENIENMPKNFKFKYFQKTGTGLWRIEDKLRKHVLYKSLNLMNKEFPFRKKFHMIFCRNVMIYFDNETRANLLRKFFDCLAENGFLFIGHSESVSKSNELFEYIQPALYRRR